MTRRALAALLGGGLTVLCTVALAWALGSNDPSEPAATKLAGTPTATRPAPTDYPDPRPVRGAALLRPNLQSLPPEDLRIEVVDGQRRLRFTSIIANSGRGPVETNPDGVLPCPPGQRHASQVLYRDADGDGHYERSTDTATISRPAGCMLDHEEHEHWHFDAAAKYTFVQPGTEVPVSEAEKVSFCWRDNREVAAEVDPRPERHYGDCSHDRVQGITPGWADVYTERLDDQHLNLPAELADGVYCLWNEADPLGLLLETVEIDNAAVTAVQISGTDAQAASPELCERSIPDSGS
ncbi:MAG TPA: lysyl oxidase family protein [Jiangellaceae bacterium]|nr:lysyl oxidase family protein [Jiangellaceae bacterium]